MVLDALSKEGLISPAERRRLEKARQDASRGVAAPKIEDFAGVFVGDRGTASDITITTPISFEDIRGGQVEEQHVADGQVGHRSTITAGPHAFISRVTVTQAGHVQPPLPPPVEKRLADVARAVGDSALPGSRKGAARAGLGDILVELRQTARKPNRDAIDCHLDGIAEATAEDRGIVGHLQQLRELLSARRAPEPGGGDARGDPE